MIQIPPAQQKHWWRIGLLVVISIVICHGIHTNAVQAQQPRPTLTPEPRPSLTPQATKEPTRKPKKKKSSTSTIGNAGQTRSSANGIVEIAGEQVFALQFIQARNPDWVGRPFFARFDSEATWMSELRPAFSEPHFFFD